MPPAAAEQPLRPRGERFLTNILWSWMGVGANLFVGFILSPYIIRKLGQERYGIWALVFSILDYFWFFDLGLNTAVCNFCARYLALKEHDKINQVMSTALFYFSVIAAAIWCVAPFASKNAHKFFQVSPEYRQEFGTLILMTSVSWGLCVLLHMFVAALDGFQRFDLTSRTWIAMLVLRSAGYAAVLLYGYGLVAMALVFIATQLLGYVLNYLNFVRIFPYLRLSWSSVRVSMFLDILRYGLNSFVANSSTLALNQSGPVFIGHYLPAASVGFYALPSRLLQYAVDAVSRVGIVTRSSAAEMSVEGGREQTIGLAIYSNRYSLALFMPLAVFLTVYGRELIVRWVGPGFAAHSAPLLPVFLFSNALVLAAQFNSGSVLFGIGRHGGYARGLVVEAVFYVAGLILVVPRYGILGAACVSAVFMISVRGLYTPWLVCRALGYPFAAYMRSIYLRPLLTALPVMALARLLKAYWISGGTWLELSLAGSICGLLYAVLAFLICVAPAHRMLFLSRIPVLGPRLLPSRA